MIEDPHYMNRACPNACVEEFKSLREENERLKQLANKVKIGEATYQFYFLAEAEAELTKLRDQLDSANRVVEAVRKETYDHKECPVESASIENGEIVCRCSLCTALNQHDKEYPANPSEK